MTFNEGRGQSNLHVMHSRNWGSHRLKCDSYCVTGVCDMGLNTVSQTTHTQTHTHTHAHCCNLKQTEMTEYFIFCFHENIRFNRRAWKIHAQSPRAHAQSSTVTTLNTRTCTLIHKVHLRTINNKYYADKRTRRAIPMFTETLTGIVLLLLCVGNN